MQAKQVLRELLDSGPQAPELVQLGPGFLAILALTADPLRHCRPAGRFGRILMMPGARAKTPPGSASRDASFPAY